MVRVKVSLNTLTRPIRPWEILTYISAARRAREVNDVGLPRISSGHAPQHVTG